MTVLEFIASVISSLAWPAALGLAVWVLRKPIRRFAERLLTSDEATISATHGATAFQVAMKGRSAEANREIRDLGRDLAAMTLEPGEVPLDGREVKGDPPLAPDGDAGRADGTHEPDEMLRDVAWALASAVESWLLFQGLTSTLDRDFYHQDDPDLDSYEDAVNVDVEALLASPLGESIQIDLTGLYRNLFLVRRTIKLYNESGQVLPVTLIKATRSVFNMTMATQQHVDRSCTQQALWHTAQQIG